MDGLLGPGLGETPSTALEVATNLESLRELPEGSIASASSSSGSEDGEEFEDQSVHGKVDGTELRSGSLVLRMGTADPHGIGDSDKRDSKLRVKQRPTFSVDAHMAASDDELLRRPLPRLNQPPQTLPVPGRLPMSEVLVPPRVTSREQVLTSLCLKVYRGFMRRATRMLRAMQAGKESLARRVRQKDVWLPIEQCLQQPYLPWDWDFTPLDRGEPAIGYVPGRPARPPQHAISVEAYQRAAADFPDKAFVSELRWGVTDDAPSLQRGMLLCMPHCGALVHFEQCAAKVEKEVKAKWGFVVQRMPGMPLRMLPYSIVDESDRAGKPKFRLTNDLSWPKPGMVEGCELSINDSMDRSGWLPVSSFACRACFQ